MNYEGTTPTIHAWEKNLFGVSLSDLPKLLPGIFEVSVLAWVSIWMSGFIGTQLMGFEKSPVSPVMLAIVLGLLIGVTVRLPKTITPG